MPKLTFLGRYRAYDLYYNPLNRRIICERDTDLATVLFDVPSYTVARNWGASDEDISRLRSHLSQRHHDGT
ncbi:hypothetical protein [Bifidobacterium ramosum]|nr:hypothetical protein [Bifidobacterium ramosum]NEG70941.1 hypothetical protein [Bifidobacterium ramosum]